MTGSAEMPVLAPAAGRMPPAAANGMFRSWWRGLCWLALCLEGVSLARGEMYTSMVTVQQALETEGGLLQHLRRYLEDEASRLSDLKRFYEKVNKMHQGEATPVSNPLLAYTLIKRLQSEWMNVVHSREASDNAEALKKAYKNAELELPQFEDLEGAARALMRLQDVYSLDVKGLVKGLFQRDRSTEPTSIYHPAQLFKMSADDCFHIGKVAYDMEDFYHSISWLEEAVSLFRGSYGSWYTEDEGSLEDALDYLAFSYFRTGNISYALNLSRECLHYDPSNKRIARNVLKYEKLLGGSPPEAEKEVVLQRPNVTHLKTRDAYEELCQSLGSQNSPLHASGLYCSLETNKSPYLMLQPVKRELVSLQPYVVLYHDFITSQEAQTIKDIASPWLRRSVVASGERQSEVEYRISKSAWLKDTVDPVIGRVDLRLASLTGLNVRPPYAEYLQVVNYGIGGHYEPHFDHATSLASPVYKTNTGNRVATFMIYLSSVEVGGSTAFIYANFSVPVVQNAALFWWNLHRNGQGDADTLHAGCPVLIGDKWVANKWIHEHGQEFRRQCSPSPDE